jgi:parallel beta-helix repeat protein
MIITHEDSGKTYDFKNQSVDRIEIVSEGPDKIARGIIIKNGKIGNIRIFNLHERPNFFYEESRDPNFPQILEAMSPRGITLNNIEFQPTGGIPLYLHPGTHNIKVTNCLFTGSANSVAIYLDQETHNNEIANTTFSMDYTKRELIAIDGSSHNIIRDCQFYNTEAGGIFLYRNCGERGVIRHRKPQHNMIIRNMFVCDDNNFFSEPMIWLGSREGNRCYCFKDPDYPFGSSLDNGDFAYDNIIDKNVFINGYPKNKIRINRGNNMISGNTFDGEKADQPSYGWKNRVVSIWRKVYWKFLCLFNLAKKE